MTNLHLQSGVDSFKANYPKILLYHPDEAFRRELSEVFAQSSLEIRDVEEAGRALRILKSLPFDAAILTANRGDSASGFDVLRQIRSNDEMEALPVLILTEGADYERIVSLELGADDCMLAPFSNREIRLRVQSLLRRSARCQNGRSTKHLVIDTPRFYFNTQTLDVRVLGKTVHLTGTELRLLALMVNRLGAVVDKETLIDTLSPSTGTPQDYRIINTQMRRLRVKLGPVGESLQNVRNVGYSFLWKDSDAVNRSY